MKINNNNNENNDRKTWSICFVHSYTISGYIYKIA